MKKIVGSNIDIDEKIEINGKTYYPATINFFDIWIMDNSDIPAVFTKEELDKANERALKLGIFVKNKSLFRKFLDFIGV